MNNVENKNKNYLLNFNEIKKLSELLYEYNAEFEKISNDTTLDIDARKMKLGELHALIVEVNSKLSFGMIINIEEQKKELIQSIVNYLSYYGIQSDSVEKKLNDVILLTTNTSLVSNSKFYSFSDKIMIDYEFINFDEQGNFIGFKEEQISFIKYVLTHELLHIASINQNVSMLNDGLSEGITDMFAHLISQNFEDKSERYDFLVKICTLLTNLIGVDKMLDDYINHLGSYPNLKKMFNECNLDETEFLKFNLSMNQINQNPDNNILKVELISFIKDNIFIPALINKENKEELVNLFNNLFGGYGFICSLEDVYGENKSNI